MHTGWKFRGTPFCVYCIWTNKGFFLKYSLGVLCYNPLSSMCESVNKAKQTPITANLRQNLRLQFLSNLSSQRVFFWKWLLIGSKFIFASTAFEMNNSFVSDLNIFMTFQMLVVLIWKPQLIDMFCILMAIYIILVNFVLTEHTRIYRKQNYEEDIKIIEVKVLLGNVQELYFL